MSQMSDWYHELLEEALEGNFDSRRTLIEYGRIDEVTDCGADALEYAERFNWAIIPQMPGTKKTCVKWGKYKDEHRRPTKAELENWFCRWPDAGMVVLLGPVSDLFVIDVDGKDARDVLVNRLGGLPVAPTSWRGKKFRFHLFFRHPVEIQTKAIFTPWDSGLEFRGHGGYVVLPPSIHSSGERYRWLKNRSPFEMSLPEVPEAILDELKKNEQ